jgi:AraC-like DNA-binding protein
MTTNRIRAGTAAGLLDAVTVGGGRAERVLAAAGLSVDDLADPERMLPGARVIALFDAAAEDLGDDAFGLHFAETYDFAALGTVSYAILNAPQVHTALANFERYARTQWDGGGLRLEVGGGDARLVLDVGPEGRSCSRHYAEGAATVGLRLVRHLVGAEWRPRQVLFGHRRPARTSEHERLLGAPIRFDAEVMAALVFAAADLERPVPNADRRLLPIVQRHLDESLAVPDDAEGWLAGVRERVALGVCDGPPSIEATAARLGLSVRTLQRRLGAHAIVYKRLVDDVRRELALRYLADGKHDLTEIAFLVGYSELSAFDRAFRRWTGSTPKAHQKQLRGAPATAPRR